MCPIRFCQINGNVEFANNERGINTFGVGGFVSDSEISSIDLGNSGGQQEFGFKNTTLTTPLNNANMGQMNAVFVNCKDQHGLIKSSTCGTSVNQVVGLDRMVNNVNLSSYTIPRISYKEKFTVDGSDAVIINNVSDLLSHSFVEGESVLIMPDVYMPKDLFTREMGP